VRDFGRLDYLVNNAGWSTRIPHAQLEDLTDEVWEKTFNTNFARRVLLRARGDAAFEEAARRGDREHRVR